VQNGASAPSVFTTTTAWHVVEVWTYHWNDGQGSTPGTIGIKDLATGKVYGPWQASGGQGQGGVPNAAWVASVSFDLPAGRYQFLDSNPSTWSQNAETGHQGMAWIMATPAQATSTPTTQPAARTDWAGAWETEWGTMTLTQNGSAVTGTYTHDDGRIAGTVSGDTFTGTWNEAPTRSPPADAGDVEFTIAPDGRSFAGRWRYGSSGAWNTNWGGTRSSSSSGATTQPPSGTGAQSAGQVVALVKSALDAHAGACQMTYSTVTATAAGGVWHVVANVSTFGNAGTAAFNVPSGSSRVVAADPLAADILQGCP
jgi:hypothetical protein